MPTIKDIAPESVFTIELNAGTPGRQGPKGEQGIQGIQGPKGEPGPKPIRGIDYFTQQDISNMVTTVTSSSNSAFNENVANKTKEFNANVSAKTSAFDNNAVLKTEEFNANANSKKTDFNLNANNRTTEFNTNASNKKNEIDTYVTNKTTEFDNHVVEKINEFKEETSEYVTENELESKGYLVESDLNGYAKEKDLFSGSYNDLKDKPKIPSKTSELTNDRGFINAIPSEYVTEEEQEEFIKPYNERITENEKYISDLEATIDILTNTNKAKGELVHITDALPLPTFETTTDGNVEQETTRGVNILNWNRSGSETSNGITRTYITPTEINFKGKVENKSNAIFGISLGTLEAGTYTISFTNHDSTKLHYLISNVGNISSNYKTFTLSEIGDRYLQVFCDTEDTIDITIKFQLEKGNTATEWEKYTGGQASPNPEFPSEIEVIEGDLSYKVNGKNIINTYKLYSGMTYNHNVGATRKLEEFVGNYATTDENGVITFSSPNYEWASFSIKSDILPIGNYTLNVERENSNVALTGGTSVYICEELADNRYKIISNLYSFQLNDNLSIPKNLTLSIEDKNRCVVVTFANNKVTENASVKLKVQLEKGSVATDYEPYKEQIVPLDLKGNFVGAINDNIKDYLVTDKKKYWLEKNVGKYVFTGDENNLVLRATYNNINQFELRNYAGFYEQYNAINIISSHYKGIAFMSNTGNSWAIDNTITIIGDGNIVIMTSQFTTVEEFKAYLKEQYNNGTPVVAYYRPKTPQIIELGELPEPIKTFDGVNNIQLLANLDTEIEVTYAQDVKKYFDNKIAEISAQII